MPRYRRDKTSLWVNLSDEELRALGRIGIALRDNGSGAYTHANVVRIALRRMAAKFSVPLKADTFAVVKIGRPPQHKSAA